MRNALDGTNSVKKLFINSLIGVGNWEDSDSINHWDALYGQVALDHVRCCLFWQKWNYIQVIFVQQQQKHLILQPRHSSLETATQRYCTLDWKCCERKSMWITLEPWEMDHWCRSTLDHIRIWCTSLIVHAQEVKWFFVGLDPHSRIIGCWVATATREQR